MIRLYLKNRDNTTKDNPANPNSAYEPLKTLVTRRIRNVIPYYS